ncbi:MAG: dTDP-glucose 4,6-dehydratase [Bacteroidetes bacterium MedPE-SWsnd-G2]|nr:MAG: dTDP-glucose 4,6-dehydratase [Bacteroidetes bacterium MedPE-SWsnd-G2]
MQESSLNILIIGSKGFIGSYCVEYFSKNNKVYQCDVVTDYAANNYFVVDATNADYTEIFESEKFDVCINCSGAASVPDSLTKPLRDFTLNVVNVYKQLDAIRRFNPDCKYINLSSAAVYGNPQYLPIDENHPLKPISPYGFNKKNAEEVCKLYHENYNIKTCSLRIFSAYGNGLKKQLFWDLYKKSIGNHEISLFGTGKESRDFIHVMDVVQAIECVINKASFNGARINIANGEELRISDVVEIFFKMSGEEVKIDFAGKERKGDPKNWKADISKLKSLGYSPNITITNGLKEYAKWL